MSLAYPPTILTISSHIGEKLAQWAAPRGGLVLVIPSMGKLWESAYDATEKPLILVCFERETARETVRIPKLNRVDRQWVVVVVRGKNGFKDVLGNPRDNQPAFYEDVETIRDQCRTILSISEEFPVLYKGTESIRVQARPDLSAVFLDGYAIRFSTANDIPNVVLEAPGAPADEES